eukprot:gene7341-13072_t
MIGEFFVEDLVAGCGFHLWDLKTNDKGNCQAEKGSESSGKCHSSDRVDKKGRRTAYEVNRRSVLATIGYGLTGLGNFCALMNLPEPIAERAYNNSMKTIERRCIGVTESHMLT